MSQNLRLGAFIVAGLAMFAGAVFLIGSKESKFESNYRIEADFENVGGLMEGAPTFEWVGSKRQRPEVDPAEAARRKSHGSDGSGQRDARRGSRGFHRVD